MWEQVHLALRESFVRVATQLAVLLPAILALLAAVLIFTLVAALAALVLRRILGVIRLDERLARGAGSTLSEWAPQHSVTGLATRIVFWALVIAGFFVGISAFDGALGNAGVLTALLLPYVAHTVGAVVILIVGSLVARTLARTVLIGAGNMNLQYARFLSLGVKWLVLVLTAAMVLEHLGIGGTVIELAFGILFGGIVLTLALAVGLGSRDLVSRSLERDTVRRPEETVKPISHF